MTRFLASLFLLGLSTVSIPSFAENKFSYLKNEENQCYEKSTSRPEQGECLDKVVKKAQALLESSHTKSLEGAKALDQQTDGAYKVEKHLEESHKKFKEYIEAECNYVWSTYTSGNGGGDAYMSCLIDMIIEHLD